MSLKDVTAKEAIGAFHRAVYMLEVVGSPPNYGKRSTALLRMADDLRVSREKHLGPPPGMGPRRTIPKTRDPRK